MVAGGRKAAGIDAGLFSSSESVQVGFTFLEGLASLPFSE